jgi:triosephosphate isomerase (TIM)
MAYVARTPLVAGNWKLYKSPAEATQFMETYSRLVEGRHFRVETLVCPTYLALGTALQAMKELGSPLQVGAQNAWHIAEGAYTGEVSAAMLKGLGVRYVIVGHSERRQYFGETNDLVAEKVAAVQALGLVPILCVGETLEQREAGTTDAVITEQLRAVFNKVNLEAHPIVVAYEPVWAIGTGKVCDAAEAQRVCGMIRALFPPEVGNVSRILYGGSVKPDNALELFQMADIDGGLVGGASLSPESFVALVEHAHTALGA